MAYHTPVMPDEVAELLRPAPGMLILDGTLGGGGHTELLLKAGANVIGLDRDADAIAEVTQRLSGYARHLRTAQANFAEVEAVLEGMGVDQLGGALLDLGVSSHQLDEGARGFAFMKNGPLDMRMDCRQSLTAADIVNHAPFEELARIFREYGEEPKAARIASRLVAVRIKKPLETTFDLTAAVESVIHRTGP
ncbi:MAG TPA: 16S rRNA (cytosine(1402)-N(4))-methyltransferase RsmH, partial [Chthoniobacterales bacterium]